MLKAVLDIRQRKNGLEVRLPVAVVSPDTNKRLTLKQRLSLFDPKKHSGEAMKTEKLGTEEC